MNSAEAIAFLGLAFVLAKVLGPIGAAIGARLRGRGDTVRDSISAEEIDQLQARLAEVEERLDFAERLLAGGGAVDQISRGAP
ncbi:MAG TPA: hypothetical protein VF046_12880 [Gemmatimonadales bacterium]